MKWLPGGSSTHPFPAIVTLSQYICIEVTDLAKWDVAVFPRTPGFLLNYIVLADLRNKFKKSSD